MKHERLMTTAEVGAMLHLSAPRVRLLVKQRKLSAVRIGPRVLRFRPEVVERFLQRNDTEIQAGQKGVDKPATEDLD